MTGLPANDKRVEQALECVHCSLKVSSSTQLLGRGHLAGVFLMRLIDGAVSTCCCQSSYACLASSNLMFGCISNIAVLSERDGYSLYKGNDSSLTVCAW